MKKIIIGKKVENKKYDFRETCFGIVVKDKKLYCTEKENEVSLIGGGIEKGETHLECLKREFMEEAGCKVIAIKELCVIDCFWLTRNNKNMESLVNIYVVKIDKKISKPTEKNNKLKIIELKEANKLLELPYHKRAIKEYKKIMNNTKFTS